MCGDTNKIRVDLTGAPETMLATLYARALDADADADADQPILGESGPGVRGIGRGSVRHAGREAAIRAS
jgi:hypothetical protein